MYCLVRFTLDDVYFVCHTKDFKENRHKKTLAKWSDKKLYEAELITICQSREILEDVCLNLNNNIPFIHIKEITEDYKVPDSHSENVCYMQQCIKCELVCSDLHDHLCFPYVENEKNDEDLESNGDDNYQLCMYCGVLCPYLEEHIQSKHSLEKVVIGIDEDLESNRYNNNNYQLCMYCGELCPHLEEHLGSKHSSEMVVSEIVDVQTKENCKTYLGKQHSCVYCQTLHFKLARHLESKHHHERDVQEALQYRKGCKQRKQLFLEIQKKGDFLYNAQNHGKMINLRRSDENRDLLPCPYCKGFYSKKYLRNHVRLYCIAKSEEKKNEFENNGLPNLICRSRSLVPVALGSANSALKSRIFPTMTENENFKALVSDKLGIEYGNYLTTKYSSSKHHDKMIKARLRQLSRLFIEMKKIDSAIEKMSCIFDPANFKVFVEAVYNMAGLKDGKFETPSLGPSTVTLILDVGGVVETEAIKNKDEHLEKDCKRFCKLLKTRCNSLINKLAMENRTQQQRAKTIVLPKTEDIRELVNLLEVEMTNCVNVLQNEFRNQKWITLNKIVLTKIMVYNRKRPGDVEKSQIVEYRNMELLNEEQIQHLQGSDRDFGTTYGRYITRGKLDRPAAVLVSKKEMNAIDILLQYRKSAKVDVSNPYLFATPCGMSEQFFKVGKALGDFCIENNLSCKNLTATKMRKHLATVTCNFGKDEQMQVSDFMGHDFNIHQNIYRQRPASLDILGMSKLLNYASGVKEHSATIPKPLHAAEISYIPSEPKRIINLEVDNLESSYITQKQFEDTNRECTSSLRSVECVTPCQMYSSEEEDGEDTTYVPDLSTIIEEDDNSTSDEEYSEYRCLKAKKNSGKMIPKSYRITRKKTWSTPERITMKKIFRYYLEKDNDAIPNLDTCQNFTFQNSVLASRSPAQIKAWIVEEKKRNKSLGPKSGWTTPLKEKCRKQFKEFYSNEKYPSSSELLNMIKENPEADLTVQKLRSHLQHDLKYVKTQQKHGRKIFWDTSN